MIGFEMFVLISRQDGFNVRGVLEISPTERYRKNRTFVFKVLFPGIDVAVIRVIDVCLDKSARSVERTGCPGNLRKEIGRFEILRLNFYSQGLVSP